MNKKKLYFFLGFLLMIISFFYAYFVFLETLAWGICCQNTFFSLLSFYFGMNFIFKAFGIKFRAFNCKLICLDSLRGLEYRHQDYYAKKSNIPKNDIKYQSPVERQYPTGSEIGISTFKVDKNLLSAIPKILDMSNIPNQPEDYHPNTNIPKNDINYQSPMKRQYPTGSEGTQ